MCPLAAHLRTPSLPPRPYPCPSYTHTHTPSSHLLTWHPFLSSPPLPQNRSPYTKKELPRYIPVASELYSFLQDNAMPRTLPDGRTESPGVLRIYLASMAILATFYACSAVLSLILRGVAGILRAVGIMGE